MIKRLWQCIVPYHPFHQTSTNISIRAELSGLIWKSCVDRWAYQENAKKLSIIVVNFIAFLMFLMPDTEKYWKFLMTMLWQIDCDVADNQSNVSFECLDWTSHLAYSLTVIFPVLISKFPLFCIYSLCAFTCITDITLDLNNVKINSF